MFHSEWHPKHFRHLHVLAQELPFLHLAGPRALLPLHLFDLLDGVPDVLVEPDIILDEFTIQYVLIWK